MISSLVLSVNYSFELTDAEELKFARLLEREHKFPLERTLGEDLEALPWVREVNYDGHFGPQILVEEVQDPTPERLREIAAIIRRHLDKTNDA